MHLRRRLSPTRSRWATPLTAAVAALALVTTAAFSDGVLKTQEVGGGPVETHMATASFDSGETKTVDDPGISAQGGEGGPRAVKEFRQDEMFSMFALQWEGHRDIAAQVRPQKADGSWGEWFTLDPLASTGEGNVNGTDIIWIEPTHAVQVSVAGLDIVTTPAAAASEVSPAPAEAPAEASVEAPAPEAAPALPYNVGDIAPVADVSPQGIEAVFVDGGSDNGIAPMADTITAGMPPVISRAGWGANEGIRCSTPTYDRGDKALTLHHTAGSNNYTEAQAASIVRGIYAYHAQTNRWCDIGYNVLVDKYGNIYEGRAGGLDKAVQGAHVGGFNSNNWGISIMGNYETAWPTQASLDAVAEIAGWKAAVSGFDPSANTRLYSGGFGGSKYPAGTYYTGPAFTTHGDLHNNACPGQYVKMQMDSIRQATYQKYLQVSNNIDNPIVDPLNPEDPTNPDPGNPGAEDPAVDARTSSEIAGWDPNNPDDRGGSSISPNEMTAILAIAGTVGALALGAGDVASPEANQAIAGDLTASQIADIAGQVVSITGDPELASTYGTVLNTFGPLLGLSVGGPNFVTPDLAYQLYQNGVVLVNNGEVYALIGEIAKAWAQQENASVLGLPISNQYEVQQTAQHALAKALRVDFQGGYITYNPETQKVDIFTH